MATISNFFNRIYAAMRSPRGRDTGIFLLFVAISSVLWIVLSLNEEEQRDVRMSLRFTHVPDSVTLISNGPEMLNVSLRARGTQLMKMSIGSTPTVNIDFRAYRSEGAVKLSNADLKAAIRNAAGGAQVNVVYPDTLQIPYSTRPGYLLPVYVDSKVSAGPQAALLGKIVSPDSVKIYVANGAKLPDSYTRIETEPVRLIGIDRTVTRRVKLIAPPMTRAIPDSVDVTFQVEPMIFKSRKVVIEPVNVPSNIKLITFPAQIDAFFMVPMSAYSNGDIRFRVVADYNSIDPASGSRMVRLKLTDVPDVLYNVQLSVDSAEYIIERH